ncbi:MAG: hypothetical protein IT323_04255 [Anaerolineae bacterium]|nr:hypothetical protein [Anaerolineae bacterium]
MTDLYDRIISQRQGLERIFARIPGFRGYAEMNARREADRMLREHVVHLLKEQMTRLVNAEKKLISSGGLAVAGKTRSAKTQFQVFIDKVNTAAPGYSGFYAAEKIGPDELQRIYAFDAALLDYVDKFKTAIDGLSDALSGQGDTEAKIGELETLAQEAVSAFDMRENVLREIY